jgi:diguanylate cyclase (GGDEF)-like protein
MTFSRVAPGGRAILAQAMDARSPTPTRPRPEDWTSAGVAFAGVLFVVAWTAVLLALRAQGGPLPQGLHLLALFFLAYGLFTISVGYRGPDHSYYSFDRVAQVASVLVLGPVDAAWINGIASLLYPLHRLRHGVGLRSVLNASLVNSGTMSLGILLAGLLYTRIGGEVPLMVLDGRAVLALLVLVLALQVLNDTAMFVLNLLLGRGNAGTFSLFSYALELGAAATGALVALVHNRLELSAFVLLLLVLGVGMLALRQFALMRFRLVGIVEERTRSLVQKTLELERLATLDNLTGLFNRRYADSWLGQQVELVSRHPQPFTVALADIDYFKQINDHHSHATGDEVLRRVAAILQARCRASDVVARYGGEEFLFCFPNTGINEASALCETLRAAVAAADWAGLGLARAVTISFGLATVREGATLESLLREADEHLYVAKNTGRNRVVAQDAAAHPAASGR